MKKIDEAELKELFNRIKQGDEQGITLLYEKYHNIVYGIAFSILKNKDNSEDIVQNVFAKILKLDKEQFPSQGEASWLYTVTKNETFQFLRKQKQIVDIDELYSLESESDEISDIVDMASYYKLLESLKPIDKEIISLRILSDFTFDKIAQMLNMPIGTVEWRYYKSLHCIKLSLTNLAAFVIVFLAIKSTKNLVYNAAPISSSESPTTQNTTQNTSSQSSNSLSNYIHHGGITFSNITVHTITDNASDTTAASSSATNYIDALFNVSIIITSIVFIGLAVFFAFKKKIKKK